MATTAYIGLGSNLGDRQSYLDRAVAALRQTSGIDELRLSSIYETAPVGGPVGQGAYLNAVAEVITTLDADVLLDRLLTIETECGRVRTVRDGPRTLDLDQLLHGTTIRDDEHLRLPHPRLAERLFVLIPLAEIAPGAVHPVTGKTVADLLAELQGVRAAGPHPGRELTGLRTLVTGATSGIGRAISLELASAGADVIVHGRRSIDAAADIAQRVRVRGGRATHLLADLADASERQRLANAAWEMWNGLDIVVCNAGADVLTGPAAEWDFEQKLARLFEVDVSASIHLARDLGQRMRAKGQGCIVTVGWDQAESGMAGASGEFFAATKGAVMAFTRSLALSLAPQVRVNCIAPGWIRTAWGETASASWQERILRETPLARWGLPEDVAAMTRWLVSPAASYVTGQVFRCNGGAVR